MLLLKKEIPIQFLYLKSKTIDPRWDLEVRANSTHMRILTSLLVLIRNMHDKQRCDLSAGFVRKCA